MEKFRTLSIVNRRQDSFKANYLKNFFEFIGVFCVNYYYDNDQDVNYIKENPEVNNFDVVLCLNYSDNFVNDIKSILHNSLVYSISSLKDSECIDCLDEVCSYIYRDVFEKCDWGVGNSFLEKLLKIYEDNNLVSVFDEYTEILLAKFNLDERYQVSCNCKNKCMMIVDQLHDIFELSRIDDVGREYLLYAYYYCISKTRNFASIIKHSNDGCYKTGDCLEGIRKILDIDDNFFTAFYLQALISDTDDSYAVFIPAYLNFFISNCPCSSCKVQGYYLLSKYYVRDSNNPRILDSVKLNRKAFQKNGEYHYRNFFSFASRMMDINNPVGALEDYKNALSILIGKEFKNLDIKNMKLIDLIYVYKIYKMFYRLDERNDLFLVLDIVDYFYIMGNSNDGFCYEMYNLHWDKSLGGGQEFFSKICYNIVNTVKVSSFREKIESKRRIKK